MPSDRPLITVVIPAFCGRPTLTACLGSVRRAVRGWPHEIVLVESSGDGSAELVRSDFPEVRVISSLERLSAGAARNLGIASASGKWLFCVDQDCIVPEDWIEKLLGHLSQDGVGAAGGSIAVADESNWSGWCVYFLEFLYHYPSRFGCISDRNFLLGANSAWRTEALRKVQFPDQTLGEDRLISAALRGLGYRTVYDSAVTVYHHNRSGWREFIRYARAMGKASAQDHLRLAGWPVRILWRFPLLVYALPCLVLPFIGLRLLSAPPSYLLRYLLLLPCCLFGQLVWAREFQLTLRQSGHPAADV